MLGSRAEPHLSIKGMECRWLITFCAELTRKYAAKLQASALPNLDHLRTAGWALADLIQLMNVAGDSPSHSVAKEIKPVKKL